MSYTSTMGSVRVYLKSCQVLLHRGRPAIPTLKYVWRSQQLPSSSRSLCTNDASPDLGWRRAGRNQGRGRTDGHAGIKPKPFPQRTGEFLKDDIDRRAQKAFSPKSVFAAGTAKRTADILKKKALLVSQEDEPGEKPAQHRGTVTMQIPDQPLTAIEWRKLKESLGNKQRFDIQMMCAMFTSSTDLDIAKSLLTFVAMESGTVSYKLLLHYLALCVNTGHDAEVFEVYDIMQGSFPSLDTGASSLFIKSFSRTARWREAIDVLNQLKKVITPSPRNYGNIIEAAIRNGDRATAWSLHDELMEKELNPHPETWEVLFGVKRTEKEKSLGMSENVEHERLHSILLHMRNNQIYPQKGLATAIKKWFESLKGQNWTGHWTNITTKGVCRCCGSVLESIQLTPEEYQELKDRVMADIIQTDDVFKKTTPEELERFKTFMKKTPTFDVVVDGLNVASISKSRWTKSEMLLEVVSELERQGLTTLVLGRKHMLHPSRSWDRRNMQLIQQKAHCFFADNISEDDPFLLYATLHSGNHCRFVSRDLMRDHKACLTDKTSRQLFFKWQRGHQLVVNVVASSKIQFQSILSYDTIIQNSGDSWHIPYDDTEDRYSYEIPLRWLCVSHK